MEKVLGQKFPRALYFRMKNERQARQAAEARTRELEVRLDALEKAKAAPEVIRDEQGQEIDPELQPLTLKALKAMRDQEAEELVLGVDGRLADDAEDLLAPAQYVAM